MMQHMPRKLLEGPGYPHDLRASRDRPGRPLHGVYDLGSRFLGIVNEGGFPLLIDQVPLSCCCVLLAVITTLR